MRTEEEQRQGPPDEEWAFHYLAPKQFEALDQKAKKRQWERLWQWEFCRERYRCDEEWRAGIDEIKAKKKAMGDKIDIAEGEREEELRLEQLVKKPKHWEEIAFPCYLAEWPKQPYLSIPFEKRLGFTSIEKESRNEYPDLELGMWSPGKKTFKLSIDLTWPESVAKKKFWDWFSHQREYLGGEKNKRTAHGMLNNIKAELKALGATRLMQYFCDEKNPWDEAAYYAEDGGYPLFEEQSEWGKARNRVSKLIKSELF